MNSSIKNRQAFLSCFTLLSDFLKGWDLSGLCGSCHSISVLQIPPIVMQLKIRMLKTSV